MDVEKLLAGLGLPVAFEKFKPYKNKPLPDPPYIKWFIDNEHRYVNKYHHFSHVADDFRIFMDYVDQEFPDTFELTGSLDALYCTRHQWKSHQALPTKRYTERPFPP